MKKFGLFILMFSSLAQAEPSIIIHPKNLIEGDKITFGDIAEFKDLTSDAKKQISQLEISDAPKAGEVRRFTSFGLSEILRYSVPEVYNIKVVIPMEVTVRQKSFNLKQEDVEKAIAAWTQEGCAPCEVKISDLKIPNFSDVSGAATWELVKAGSRPRGAFYVALNIKDKSVDPQKKWVSGDIRIYKKVPVVQRLLSAGVRLHKEDYAIEDRDVTYAADTVPSENDLLGSELARTLNAKEVIWKSLLRRKMVMMPGRPVNVVMRSEGWNVNVRGVAQGSGYIGDAIRVLNPMTNKYLVGVVVDDATIEVK